MPRVHFASKSPTRLMEMKEFKDPSTPLEHDMLRVVPNETITFSRDDGAESFVEITSNSKNPISYKVQTTSPDKFRVRPRCGYIMPGETVSISILLKPDHQLSKDKFLIMSIQVPNSVDMSSIQPAEMWIDKSVSTPGVEQHRLVCVSKDDQQGSCLPSAQGGYHPSTHAKMDAGNSNYIDACGQTKLERQLLTTQILQWITLGLILLIFGFLWMTSPNAPSWKKFKYNSDL